MGFLQNLSKRIFSPYKHLLTTDQAKRWYQISQIIYFLSATCLAVHLINQITDKNKEDLKDDELEIVDHSRGEWLFDFMMKQHRPINEPFQSSSFKLTTNLQ